MVHSTVNTLEIMSETIFPANHLIGAENNT